jgi:hypothetical protein
MPNGGFGRRYATADSADTAFAGNTLLGISLSILPALDIAKSSKQMAVSMLKARPITAARPGLKGKTGGCYDFGTMTF